VHVGIDVHMTQQRAQEFIDTNGGNPFQVKVYGPDHFSTDLLFEVPMAGVGASAESGLSGDFDLVVLHWQLDEDDNFLDNDDEIFAVVTVRQEVPYPETFDYYSNQLSHEY